VVGLDRNGKVEYVNPFLLEVMGYTQTEVLGKNWLSDFQENSAQRLSASDFAELLEYDFKPYSQQLIETKLGEEKIISWNHTLLKDLQGNTVKGKFYKNQLLKSAFKGKIENKTLSLENYTTLFRLLSPAQTLKRGFAIVKKDTKILTNADNIHIGDSITVYLSDSQITSNVTEKQQNTERGFDL
jgi:PAS domain S-box-containing protein